MWFRASPAGFDRLINVWCFCFLMVRDFKGLKIWQKAMDLTENIYRISGDFPKDEIYGLTSQIRRASVSIVSNIAEGCGKKTTKDFISFLHNALGSVKEVECQLLIAGRLDYLNGEEVKSLGKEVNVLGGMIMGFINRLSEDLG